MIFSLVVSVVIIVLLLAEVALPIALILFLGVFVWRLIRKKWVNRIFAGLVYNRNPLVREFYERVGCSVEEKGNKFVKPVAYLALIVCISIILKTLWPYVIYATDRNNMLLMDELPWMFLHIGLIFVGFGVFASVISSLFFIR